MWTAALALCFAQELAFRWTVDVEDRFWQALHVLEVEEQPLAAADLLGELVNEPSVVQDSGQTGYVLAQRYRALRLAERHEEARVLLPRLRQAVSGTDFAAPAERLIVQADRMSSGGLQVDEALLQLLLVAMEQGSDSLDSLLAGYGDRLTPEILRVLDRPSLYTEQFDRPESAMRNLWVQIWREGAESVLGEMSARIENRSADYFAEIQLDSRWYSDWEITDAHIAFLIRLSLDERAEVASSAVQAMTSNLDQEKIRVRLHKILEDEAILAPLLLESLIQVGAVPTSDQLWRDELINSVLASPSGLRQVARDLCLSRFAASQLHFLATEYDDRDAQIALLLALADPTHRVVEFEGQEFRIGFPQELTELRPTGLPHSRFEDSFWKTTDFQTWRRELASHADQEIRELALLSILYDIQANDADAAVFIHEGVRVPHLMQHVAMRPTGDPAVLGLLEESLKTAFDHHFAFKWAETRLQEALKVFSIEFWEHAPDQQLDVIESLQARFSSVQPVWFDDQHSRNTLWYLLENPAFGIAPNLKHSVRPLVATIEFGSDRNPELDRVLDLISTRAESPAEELELYQQVDSYFRSNRGKLMSADSWLIAQSQYLPRYVALQALLEDSQLTNPSVEVKQALRASGLIAWRFLHLFEGARDRSIEVDFLDDLIDAAPGVLPALREQLTLELTLQHPAFFSRVLGPVFLNREYDPNLQLWPREVLGGSVFSFPAESITRLLASDYETGIRAFWRGVDSGRMFVEPALSNTEMRRLALRDAQHPRYASFALSYLDSIDLPSEQWAPFAEQAWANDEFEDRLRLVQQIGRRFEPSLINILLEAQVSQEYELAAAADDALARYMRIRESRASWEAWQRQGREGSPIDSLVERTASDRSQKVRLAAIQSLGTLEAKEALPFLVELLEDPDQAIVAAAEEAMTRIHNASTEPIDD